MSPGEIQTGYDPAKQVWGTPELVEKLLLFLDLASIKELSKVHQLTRLILGGAFFWNKLVKKTFPNFIRMDDDEDVPKDDDVRLTRERP